MSNTFKPRKVEPKAIGRWASQSIELIKRRSFSFAMTFVIFALAALLAQGMLFVIVSIIEAGWVISLARSADYGGSARWYFKGASKEIFNFAFKLFILFMVIFLLFYFVPHSERKFASDNWPMAIQLFFRSASEDQCMTFYIVLPWSLFISMSTGLKSFPSLMVLTREGFNLNINPAITLTLIGMLVPIFITSYARDESALVGVMAGLFIIAINIAILVVGYVGARDVFEGRGENQKAKLSAPVLGRELEAPSI